MYRGVISNPRAKGEVLKIKVRPIEKKEKLYFQLESFTRTQAFHENLAATDASKRILDYMEIFRQLQIVTRTADYTVLVSKKGKVTIQNKQHKKVLKEAKFSHNRSKKYILQEGVAVPFLQDLGVMTSDGKVVRFNVMS